MTEQCQCKHAPSFLKIIVERVVQEPLETKMTEHVCAALYERTATGTGDSATATSS